ncbi:hypothetical protein BCI9360_03338 [Bacillus sp. CECT 9360]|nr:hypothetical protein BCI9360_03338 [Bacillus sp. CECT 9360]
MYRLRLPEKDKIKKQIIKILSKNKRGLARE